jgi:hypothetical protein
MEVDFDALDAAEEAYLERASSQQRRRVAPSSFVEQDTTEITGEDGARRSASQPFLATPKVSASGQARNRGNRRPPGLSPLSGERGREFTSGVQSQLRRRDLLETELFVEATLLQALSEDDEASVLATWVRCADLVQLWQLHVAGAGANRASTVLARHIVAVAGWALCREGLPDDEFANVNKFFSELAVAVSQQGYSAQDRQLLEFVDTLSAAWVGLWSGNVSAEGALDGIWNTLEHEPVSLETMALILRAASRGVLDSNDGAPLALTERTADLLLRATAAVMESGSEEAVGAICSTLAIFAAAEPGDNRDYHTAAWTALLRILVKHTHSNTGESALRAVVDAVALKPDLLHFQTDIHVCSAEQCDGECGGSVSLNASDVLSCLAQRSGQSTAKTIALLGLCRLITFGCIDDQDAEEDLLIRIISITCRLPKDSASCSMGTRALQLFARGAENSSLFIKLDSHQTEVANACVTRAMERMQPDAQSASWSNDTKNELKLFAQLLEPRVVDAVAENFALNTHSNDTGKDAADQLLRLLKESSLSE